MPESPRSKSKTAKPHYEGHRQRLRARLLEAGGDALQDYELLELILFAALPRRDVKPLAKQLLQEMRGVWNLLNADPALLRSLGLGDATIALLRSVALLGLRAHRSAAFDAPLLNNWERIVDYCRAAMAHERKEQFRLLFLDRRNQLIREEVQGHGTIDHTPVYPREVVHRALELGAGALVLVHNHPTGDVTPSKADVDMTRAIIDACTPLEIIVHDHMIVGRDKVTSFKSLGLM